MAENSNDLDLESAAKKRRRSKWDAPATSAGSVTSDKGSISSSVLSLDPAIAQHLTVDNTQIQLNQQALAQTMMSRLSTPFSALTGPVPTAVISATASRLDCRVYVGSLHYNISEADIRALFSPFGAISKVDMSLDAATGRSKGFCFVEFCEPASSIAALDMNAFEIAGRKIKVGRPSGATTAATPATAAPTVATALSVTNAVSAKTQAQALLNQALGLPVSDTVTAGASTGPPRALVIRNIRNEINAAELHAVFLPFGAISFCNFIGQQSVIPALTGPIAVRSALMEYKAASSAAECAVSMNGFSLGGVHLLVEAVDSAMADALRGSLQTVVVHTVLAEKTGATKEKDSKDKPTGKNKCTTVILENLVSFEDASDPTLKGEIAEEAEKQGKLKNINIVIDQKKSVKIFLTYCDPLDAEKSYNVMNGRFFGGKTVTAILAP